MKIIITLILLTGLNGLQWVEAQAKKRADSVRVTIQLDNTLNKRAPVDSVMVIFDRFNLTGAGTIKRVFHPVNNEVVIENVPEGKFYITVICLGLFNDSFSEVSYVYEKRKNNNAFKFRLKPNEAFDPAAVYIPAEKIDPQNLAILKKKVRRRAAFGRMAAVEIRHYLLAKRHAKSNKMDPAFYKKEAPPRAGLH